MTNTKSTKRALLTSVMAMLLCFTMLLGTTFAWFTDSVTSGSNVIQTGNLDIEVEYTLDGENWANLDGANNLFQKGLWEPGHTEVVALRITNNGSLALKYAAYMNIVNETTGKTADGKDIVLSDILTVSTMELGPMTDDEFGEMILSSTISGAFEDGLKEDSFDKTAAFKETNLLYEGNSLKAGETAYVFVQVDMPETVGNDANAKDKDSVPSIEFGINVLATQTPHEEDSFTPDYDKDASLEEAIFVEGGVYNMTADRNEGINVSAGAKVVINGNGYAINSDSVGLQNSGNVVVNDVHMNAGNAADYSNITRGEDAKTEYNNVDVISAGGGIGAADGAEVVFNSGSVYVDTASTSGRYIFYAEGEGTTITINGGTFSWDENDNQKRAYIYAGAGTTVYVKGGTFGKASTRDGYTAGIMGDGTVIITGGTFGFDPSAWVADGYHAVKAGNVYYVVPVDAAVVSNSTELMAAINAGNTEIYLLAGTFEFDWENKDLLDGVTIIGTSAEDSTLQFTGYGPDADADEWSLNGLTLENVTVVDRCKPENGTYSYWHSYFYVSGLTATNVVFETGVKTVNDESTFTNCTFISNYYWDYSTKDYCTDEEMYGLVANGDVTVEGCSFTGFRGIDVSAACAVTVKGSTFNVTNTEKDPINVKNTGATVTVDGEVIE